MSLKIRRLAQFLFALAVLAGAGPASAADTTVSLGAGVSTLGITAEGGFRYGGFGARLLGNYYSYSGSDTVDNVDYHGTLSLRSIGAAADWYPFESYGFRLSAGLLINGNSLKGDASPSSNITIGDTTYTPAQVGTLNVKVKYANKVAPYVGLGYVFDLGSGILLTPQAGVTFQGDSQVTLTSTSAFVTQADLAKETTTITNDANKLSVYPVISLTLSFKI
jgi:hypothetical protein